MRPVEPWQFSDIPVSSLMAIRPGVMAVLEKHGMDPFTVPSVCIGSLCNSRGVAWVDFVAEIGDLEIPGRNTDWAGLPLFHLLDFLTEEHREFIQDFLPAIKNGFAADQDGKEASGPMRSLLGEFQKRLEEHSRLEREVLFALAGDLEKRLYDRFISGGAGPKAAPASHCMV